jgi:tetraacyldisaccharide 4'-kinase
MRRVLWSAAQIYGAVSWLRNRLYDRGCLSIEKAPVPVVSVGNLTLGGTGKTPCVEFIARYFSDAGRRVGILSRGYAASVGPNDEAMVLEQNLPDVPHLQGPNRAELARLATEELESEVLLLDDGFQHRRLARDLDLVLVDATQPWGFAQLFPRGLLREGVTGLRRANAVIVTRCDLVSAADVDAICRRVQQLVPNMLVAETCFEPVALIGDSDSVMPVEHIKNGPIAAFCGIGNAEAFFQTLRRLGADLRATRSYPDHFRYARTDVEELEKWAQDQPSDGIILTTQKDLVKLRLPRLANRPLWALRIGLAFRKGEEEFRKLLDRVLQ